MRQTATHGKVDSQRPARKRKPTVTLQLQPLDHSWPAHILLLDSLCDRNLTIALLVHQRRCMKPATMTIAILLSESPHSRPFQMTTSVDWGFATRSLEAQFFPQPIAFRAQMCPLSTTDDTSSPSSSNSVVSGVVVGNKLVELRGKHRVASVLHGTLTLSEPGAAVTLMWPRRVSTVTTAWASVPNFGITAKVLKPEAVW